MAKRSRTTPRKKAPTELHLPGDKIINGIPIPKSRIFPTELFAMLAQALGALLPGARPRLGARGPRRPPVEKKWLDAQTLVDAADGLDPAKHAVKRESLARRALRLSKDHAEAWCVLADQAPNANEAVAAYGEAVEAGERFLGKTLLARARGAVGEVPGGAGLLRARRGLVDALSAIGRVDEAIDAGLLLLKLDVRDPASVGPFLLALAIGQQRWEVARHLLAVMDEDEGVHVPWGRALVEFGEMGDVPSARAALERAVKVNRHVAGALLGDEPNRRGRPGLALMEAEIYTEAYRSSWLDVPGAVAWLRASIDAVVATLPKRGRPARGAKPQSRLPAAEAPARASLLGPPLHELPQDIDDVWEVDHRQMPSFIRERGEQPRRPWGTFVVSRSGHHAVGHGVAMERRADADVADDVVRCLRKERRRPASIEVTQPGLRAAILARIDGAGIDVLARDGLITIDSMLQAVTETLGHVEDREPLLAVPGVTLSLAADFHAAAAAFHRARPWRRVPVDTPIRASGGPARVPLVTAVVMGQRGVQQGLAIYDDPASLRLLLAKGEAGGEGGQGLSVLFGEACQTLELDLLAVEQHGFEVAAPEAYPDIVRIETATKVRPPSARDVELATRLLRAVAAFLAAVPRGSGGSWRSPCGLELSWE